MTQIDDLQRIQQMLSAYFNKSIEMLNAIGIKTGKITKVSINSRSAYCWGCAKHNLRLDIYQIEISNLLIVNAYKEEKENEEFQFTNMPLLQTLIHECLHCVKGCNNHGKKWKDLANEVNKTYGLSVSRTNDSEELKVDFDKKNYRYVCECEKCHIKIGRNKMSRFVKHPEKYACVPCREKGIKASFVRIK